MVTRFRSPAEARKKCENVALEGETEETKMHSIAQSELASSQPMATKSESYPQVAGPRDR